MCGLPSNETIDANDIRVQAPVRPFRMLKPNMLPSNVRKNFLQLHWMPIFSLMAAAPDLKISPAMDAESISFSLSVGKHHLKTRSRHVFESDQATPDQWGVSTWSKKVARSSILKHGNAADKANLPVATRHNRPRRNPRNRPLADLRRTRRRAESATDGEEPVAANDGDGLVPDDGDRLAPDDGDGLVPDDGDGLLPVVNLTATAIARGEEIEREVNEEMTEESREQRRLANVGRPDGHCGLLFVGPRPQN
jgi:hypothetical protein